jgi:hypothetical protein
LIRSSASREEAGRHRVGRHRVGRLPFAGEERQQPAKESGQPREHTESLRLFSLNPTLRNLEANRELPRETFAVGHHDQNALLARVQVE